MEFNWKIVLLIACLIQQIAADCPRVISRRGWGGKTPKQIEYQTFPVKYVIVHHTVSQKCDKTSTCSEFIRNIQSYHMDSLDNWDIGYNFLIGNDGNVYEGAGWHKVGAHTYGYNKKSIGIAFIGDFSDELPSEKALNVAKEFLACGVSAGELDRRYKLLGGRQIHASESPGLRLYQELQDWKRWSSSIA